MTPDEQIAEWRAKGLVLNVGPGGIAPGVVPAPAPTPAPNTVRPAPDLPPPAPRVVVVLDVPVRLASEANARGTLRPVHVRLGVPCTAAGEFPRRADRPAREPESPGGLFAGVKVAPAVVAAGPVILVFAAKDDQDRAYEYARLLWLKGYDAEARTEPEGG